MAIRLLSARGQSTAELSTDARRASAFGVGVVGRHHQVVLRHLGVERGDVGLEGV